MRTSSICFSFPVSQRSPILLEFSLFSAQILGFSADFYRKSLDIVKQHPNRAEIWAEIVFQSIYQGQTLVNVSSTVLEIENLELENGRKSGF